MGLTHVVGATGDLSDKAAMARLGLATEAYIDMGDFVGGLCKYLRRNPVARLTIAGGFGKISKLAQGAMDLHSARGTVDLELLRSLLPADIREKAATADTANMMLAIGGADLACSIARLARDKAQAMVGDVVTVDVLVIDRAGTIVGESG
jgi:cobalt-precorrin-5B (C1)-methyltransferase